MSEIPEDIRAKAMEVWRSMPETGDDEAFAAIIERALSAERKAATEAERARCAKIAEDEDGHFSHWGEDRNTRVSQKTCSDIAARIRSPNKPGEAP